MTERNSIDGEKNLPRVSTAPLWFGGLITLGYCIGIGILFRAKIATIDTLSLNNAGDFLAGLFAPLALSLIHI